VTRAVFLILTLGASLAAADDLDPCKTTGDDPDVLVATAQCYEHLQRVGAAILYLAKAADEKPSTAIDGELGDLYLQIAYFDRAADAYEKAGQLGDGNRFGMAVLLRLALGDRDRARADADAYGRSFGALLPERAAELAFQTIGDLDDDAVARLTANLQKWGKTLGPDQIVAVEARLADLAHDCPLRTDGLCVSLRPRPVSPDRLVCSPGVPIVTVVPRDPARAQQVSAAMAIATSEWAGGKAVANLKGDEARPRESAARAGMASLLVHAGDLLAEQLLALGLPALDFSPAQTAASQKKLATWMSAAQKLRAEAHTLYEQAASTAPASRWMSESFFREGELWLDLYDELAGATIPAAARAQQDTADAYCDEIMKYATPLRDEAVKAFAACAQNAATVGLLDPASTACRQRLGELAPKDFPPDEEILPDPPALDVMIPRIPR
jgi:tetratricopeptide (TPR) repeat protein